MIPGCRAMHSYLKGDFWYEEHREAEPGCGQPDKYQDILVKFFYDLPDLINIIIIGIIHFSVITDQSSLKNVNTICIRIYSRGKL